MGYRLAMCLQGPFKALVSGVNTCRNTRTWGTIVELVLREIGIGRLRECTLPKVLDFAPEPHESSSNFIDRLGNTAALVPPAVMDPKGMNTLLQHKLTAYIPGLKPYTQDLSEFRTVSAFVTHARNTAYIMPNMELVTDAAKPQAKIQAAAAAPVAEDVAATTAGPRARFRSERAWWTSHSPRAR